MAAVGYDVVAAAPGRDYSGASSAIGPIDGEGLEVTEVELSGLPGVPAYGVDGPPALAVIVARLGGFGPSPDLVVSGINPGPNTGRSVLHSGTVGAALSAQNFGLSALAVSIGTGDPSHLDTAAKVAVDAVSWLRSAADRTVLNVNVPNLPVALLRGVRIAPLAPFGTVRTALGERIAGRLQLEWRETEHELPPDCDTSLVRAGYVTVTSLVGIRAAEDAGALAAIQRGLEVSRAAG